MDHNSALIIANVFFAASFIAERRAAWAATIVFGWIWIAVAFLVK